MVPRNSHSTPSFARPQSPHEPTRGPELHRFRAAIERCLGLLDAIRRNKTFARGGVTASHCRDLEDAVREANTFVDAAEAVCAARCDSGLTEFEGVTAESACAAVLKLSEQVLSAAGKAGGRVGRAKLVRIDVECLRVLVIQETAKASRNERPLTPAAVEDSDRHRAGEPDELDTPPWDHIWSKLPRLTSRLLDYLWQHGRSPNRLALFGDVTAHVWDKNKDVTRGAVRGLLNRTNRILEAHKIGYLAHLNGDFVYLD